MRKVVVNTTPLIALSHVGQLEVLKKLYGRIIIPEAVYRELSVKIDTILQCMTEKGIYISKSLIELCLKQVGEI